MVHTMDLMSLGAHHGLLGLGARHGLLSRGARQAQGLIIRFPRVCLGIGRIVCALLTDSSFCRMLVFFPRF